MEPAGPGRPEDPRPQRAGVHRRRRRVRAGQGPGPRRRHQVPRAGPTTPPEPEQIHGNTKLEVGWTLIPALILFAIAIPTIATIFDLSQKPDNALNVTVIGHQFWWEYRYDDLGIVTANELHIPAGRARRAHPRERRRDPQLLDPAAGRQDRRHPRPHQPHAASRPTSPAPTSGQCTEFCGAVPRQHAGQGHRPHPGRLRRLGGRQRAAAGRPRPTAARRPRAWPCSTPRAAPAATPSPACRRARSGPTSPTSTAATTFAGSMFDLNEDNLRKLARRPARGEARLGDARPGPHRRGDHPAHRLPGDVAVTAHHLSTRQSRPA